MHGLPWQMAGSIVIRSIDMYTPMKSLRHLYDEAEWTIWKPPVKAGPIDPAALMSGARAVWLEIGFGGGGEQLGGVGNAVAEPGARAEAEAGTQRQACAQVACSYHVARGTPAVRALLDAIRPRTAAITSL